MVNPAVKMHQLYSVQFYDGLDILFEDLDVINYEVLHKFVLANNPPGDKIYVTKWMYIDTSSKIINIQGCKLNESKYLINREGHGMNTTISYTCSDQDIRTGLYYLYHMYTNLKTDT